MNEKMKKYRESLLSKKDFLSDKYDKLLVTLSGGALPLSVTIFKDTIDQNTADCLSLLYLSWGAFVASLISVLLHIKLGISAQQKAVDQVDKNTIYSEKPGGGYSSWIPYLSIAALVFFLIGLIFIAVFIKC